MVEQPRNRRLVVAGTDTGVGKTVLSAALCLKLGAAYWKPVQAGLDGETDSDVVRRLGVPAARVLPEAYRLRLPASPHIAAAAEGIEIDPSRLAPPPTDLPLVIECAGGLMVPLTPTLLQIDQIARWDAPVVLAARTTLGTINHTLLSLGALRARDIACAGVVFIGAAEEAVERTIAEIGRVRWLGRLPRLEPLDAATLATATASLTLPD